MRLKFIDHGFQPFLKIPAIAGTSQKRTHIQTIYRCFGQDFWRVATDNLARKAFCNSGFANTRIPNEKRVILASTAKHLHTTFNFFIAPNQRVNVSFGSFGIQIYAIFGQRRFFGLFSRVLITGKRVILFFTGSYYRPRFAIRRILCHAMGNKIHRIVAGHILLLEEIGCV